MGNGGTLAKPPGQVPKGAAMDQTTPCETTGNAPAFREWTGEPFGVNRLLDFGSASANRIQPTLFVRVMIHAQRVTFSPRFALDRPGGVGGHIRPVVERD